MSENQPQNKSFQGKEKPMIILLIILIIILVVKSTLLDEVKNLTPEEQQFKYFVEYSVDREYSGFLSDMGIMVYRVYDIYMADTTKESIIRYQDATTGKIVEVVQKGRYIGKVRGYLLWVIPIKHFSITAQIIE